MTEFFKNIVFYNFFAIHDLPNYRIRKSNLYQIHSSIPPTPEISVPHLVYICARNSSNVALTVGLVFAPEARFSQALSSREDTDFPQFFFRETCGGATEK